MSDHSKYKGVAQSVSSSGFLEFLAGRAKVELYEQWQNSVSVEEREKIHSALAGIDEITFQLQQLLQEMEKNNAC